MGAVNAIKRGALLTLTGAAVLSLGGCSGGSSPEPTDPFYQLKQDIAHYDEMYGFKLDRFNHFLDENRKSDDQVHSIIEGTPREEWPEIVVEYYEYHSRKHIADELESWGEYLAGEIDRMAEPEGGCRETSHGYRIGLNDERLELYCDPAAEDSNGQQRISIRLSSIYGIDDLLLTDSPDEAKRRLTELAGRVRADPQVLAREGEVEVFLAEQVKEAFRHLLGEAPEDSQVELDNPEILELEFKDRQDNEVIASIGLDSPVYLEQAKERFDEVAHEDGLWLDVNRPFEATATHPVYMNGSPQRFASEVWLIAHEFAHHLFENYPLAISGPIGETSAEVIALEITLEVLGRYYPEFLEDTMIKGRQEPLALAKMYYMPESDYKNPLLGELRKCSHDLREFFDYVKDDNILSDVEADINRCRAGE